MKSSKRHVFLVSLIFLLESCSFALFFVFFVYLFDFTNRCYVDIMSWIGMPLFLSFSLLQYLTHSFIGLRDRFFGLRASIQSWRKACGRSSHTAVTYFCGGRGIRVTERWKASSYTIPEVCHSETNFAHRKGETPKKKKKLDKGTCMI